MAEQSIYTVNLKLNFIYRLPMADPSTRIWLDDVVCSSNNDLTLSQCRHQSFGINNCDHSQDIILSCSSADSFFSSGCRLQNNRKSLNLGC